MMGNTTVDAETDERKKTFYTINFNNEEERIEFSPSIQADNIEIVSLLLSLYDNIHAQLLTSTLVYDIGAGDVTVTLTNGLYTAGADLVASLNILMGGAGFTWTFDSASKRITVANAANFSIDDCRLLNLIIGLNDVDGSTNSYTSTQILNLFPISHYIVQCDKIVSNSYYASNRTASILIPTDTFDFVSASTIKFDRNSYYNGTMQLYGGNVFPMRLELFVLFLDDSIAKIPFSENQKCSLTLAVY